MEISFFIEKLTREAKIVPWMRPFSSLPPNLGASTQTSLVKPHLGKKGYKIKSKYALRKLNNHVKRNKRL